MTIRPWLNDASRARESEILTDWPADGAALEHMADLAELVVAACSDDPASVAGRVTEFRSEFRELEFINP